MVLYGSICCHRVLFGSVRSLMVPHCPVWFRIVKYGPLYSCMVPCSPVWTCMVFRLFRIVIRFVWIFTNMAKIFTRIIRLVSIATSLEIAPDIKCLHPLSLSGQLFCNFNNDQHFNINKLLKPLSPHRNVIPFLFLYEGDCFNIWYIYGLYIWLN